MDVRSFEALERECDDVLWKFFATSANGFRAAQVVIATGSGAMKIGLKVSVG